MSNREVLHQIPDSNLMQTEEQLAELSRSYDMQAPHSAQLIVNGMLQIISRTSTSVYLMAFYFLLSRYLNMFFYITDTFLANICCLLCKEI